LYCFNDISWLDPIHLSIYEQGHSPFTRWFLNINAIATAKITTALYRLAQGNVSNTKSVGKGVFKYKVNFGPGYRIYYAMDENTLVILLNDGTKQRQKNDIRLSQNVLE